MKYTGRIITSVFMLCIITLWHLSYFWIDWNEAYHFLIIKKFIIYDFIYTPFLLPIVWWLGKQFDKARFYSEKDILTEVYNRRFVLSMFPKLVAQTQRKSECLSLIIIDCNHFKLINDSFGHKKGDFVLKELASILSSQTRKGDSVARWGGDEFLIIAPFTDSNGCKVMTKRIESELETLSQQMGMDISISVGTAISPTDGTLLDDLLQIADTRMYKVKASIQN